MILILAHRAPEADHELVQAKRIPEDSSLEEPVRSERTDLARIAS